MANTIWFTRNDGQRFEVEVGTAVHERMTASPDFVDESIEPVESIESVESKPKRTRKRPAKKA